MAKWKGKSDRNKICCASYKTAQRCETNKLRGLVRHCRRQGVTVAVMKERCKHFRDALNKLETVLTGVKARPILAGH